MATQLKEMKGEEFIKKILDGERDFSRVRLEGNFNFSAHEGFGEMQNYLKEQDLCSNPIDITSSEFINITAIGLHLPYVRGKKANLDRANLREAYLRAANLERSKP